ncbi:Uncharacterised protein [Bordetella pertussis]|nr:Uncharacterised protein [Bordetella pertussis]CFP70183.1 Uncharacterised protein [Bordetella pertussis]CFW47434.1 Uncharacterised protein [Bordetella pertussis]
MNSTCTLTSLAMVSRVADSSLAKTLRACSRLSM